MQQVRFVGLQSDAYGPLRVRRRRDFQVGNGDAYFECGNDQLLAPLAVVKDASLTSLKNAYVQAHRVWGGSPEDPTPLYVSPMHPESFDPELAPYQNLWLMVSASLDPRRGRVRDTRIP